MNATSYRRKYLFGLQFQRVSHGREKWQQAPDMAIGSAERPHLERQAGNRKGELKLARVVKLSKHPQWLTSPRRLCLLSLPILCH